MAKLMGLSLRGKYVLPNFLYGEYSGKVSDDAILYSTGFMLSRTLVASFLIVTFLLIERFAFIYPSMSAQDKINKKLFKDPNIGISSRERRVYRKYPEKTLKKLRGNFKDVQQEVSTILSSTSVNAFWPLSLLSNYLDKNKNIELLEFESDNKKNRAVFKSKKGDDLKKLGEHLRDLALPNKKITLQKGKNILTLVFGKNND